MVYIEIFIAENLLINYLIIYLSKKFLCIEQKHLRTFAASCIGVTYGYFQVQGIYPVLDEIYIKILVSLGMCFAAYGITNIRQKIKEFFCLYFFTFIFGGSAYAFIGLFGGSVTQRGIVLGSSEFVFLLISIFTAFLVADIFMNSGKKRRVFKELLYDIEVINKDRSVKLTAFLDTGNTLTDRYGDAVCIIEEKYAKKVFDLESERSGEIYFNTVSGMGILPLYKAEQLIACGKRIKDAKFAVFRGMLSKGRTYSALLGIGYISEVDNEI